MAGEVYSGAEIDVKEAPAKPLRTREGEGARDGGGSTCFFRALRRISRKS
jgi:hypothetical protein